MAKATLIKDLGIVDKSISYNSINTVSKELRQFVHIVDQRIYYLDEEYKGRDLIAISRVTIGFAPLMSNKTEIAIMGVNELECAPSEFIDDPVYTEMTHEEFLKDLGYDAE